MSPSAAWIVLYSLMPARWTALSIASGGIVATPLFLVVGSIGVPALGVAGAVALVAASGGLAYYLLSKTDGERLAEANSQESEHRKPAMALKASLSVIAHGISYGFIVVMVSSLGLHAILIAGAAGIVSSFVAFFWARRRTKTSWTTESAQRITIPLIAAALLFAPFCSEAGRIVCGAVGIGAFSYATLMEWAGRRCGRRRQVAPSHRPPPHDARRAEPPFGEHLRKTRRVTVPNRANRLHCKKTRVPQHPRLSDESRDPPALYAVLGP